MRDTRSLASSAEPRNPIYRWNVTERAEAFDAAAEHVHPHYLELQDAILRLLSTVPVSGRRGAGGSLIVDIGGGSGRLAERLLDAFPSTRVCVVDQSGAFLDLARRRLERFDDRAGFVAARLQDDWESRLSGPADAIVSTSAIHHLAPDEKRVLYRRCRAALRPDGVFANADEVRPEDDTAYLAEMRAWIAHKERAVAAGLIPEAMQEAFRGWEERNVARFGRPKTSGDDDHETVEAQLAYLAEADSRWQRKEYDRFRGIHGENTPPSSR